MPKKLVKWKKNRKLNKKNSAVRMACKIERRRKTLATEGSLVKVDQTCLLAIPASKCHNHHTNNDDEIKLRKKLAKMEKKIK